MIQRISFLLFVLACCIVVPAQSQSDNRARLCFRRPENNGAMNTLGSWIRISDYNIPIIGGQEICLYLDPESIDLEKLDLRITSLYPYDPHSKNEEACKSKSFPISLKQNEKRTFQICPAVKGESYACGWSVKQISPQSNLGCGDMR